MAASLKQLESEFNIQYREHQIGALERLIAGQNVILHAVTGGGKSIVFQSAAKLFKSDGIVVVIYPLKALIEDQVISAAKYNVSAELYYGDTSKKKRIVIQDRIENDPNLEMILTVPEMIQHSKKLRECLYKRGVSLVAIDEAHVYDEWALSFRNSYHSIGKFLHEIRCKRYLLCSATITAKGAINAARSLAVTNWSIVKSPVTRPGLIFSDVEKHPLAWLGDTLSGAGGQAPGIAFFTWRKTIDDVVEKLKSRHENIITYHGAMRPKARKHNQDLWTKGNEWVFATKAFGMGIDKANVRSIYHAQLSASVLDYAQEVGRASRDGLPSNCYLSKYDCVGEDTRPQGNAASFLVKMSYPTVKEVKRVWDYLMNFSRGVNTIALDMDDLSSTVFGSDRMTETARKCLFWLSFARMIEKNAKPDKWTFDFSKSTVSAPTRSLKEIMMLESLMRAHGDQGDDDNLFSLRTAEMDDLIAPKLSIVDWKAAIKRWTNKNYINCEYPGPADTTINILSRSFSDFNKARMALDSARENAENALDAMKRIAREPAWKRASLIEQEISIDEDQFRRGIERIRDDRVKDAAAQ